MNNHQIRTDLGIIVVHYNAIQSLIKGVISEFFIEQSKNADGIPDLELIDSNGTRIIELEQGGIGVNISAQMIYGAMLPRTTQKLFGTLQKNIFSLADLEVKNININVEKIRVPNKNNST